MPIGVNFDKSKPDYLLLFLYLAIYQKKLALNSHFKNFDFGSGGATPQAASTEWNSTIKVKIGSSATMDLCQRAIEIKSPGRSRKFMRKEMAVFMVYGDSLNHSEASRLRRAALAESPWTATSKYCFITLSA